MARRLVGRAAVVTGGGSGIGRSVALDLAAEGAGVVVNDLGVWSPGQPVGARPADLVAAEIKRLGGKAVANYEDIAIMAGGESVIKAAIDNFGRIDVLVCCAGIIKRNTIDETTEEEWDRTMAVHVKGHFSCAKSAASHMKQQRSGRIITVSSRAAFGIGGSPAYSAAKAAILGLTKILALELGPYGITVNSILPSALTPLFSTEKRYRNDGIPPARTAGPEMVSPLVVYLATDEARNINGQFFYAGGGDIALYSQERPAQMLHKDGKWTVDELAELVPHTFGINLVNPAPPE